MSIIDGPAPGIILYLYQGATFGGQSVSYRNKDGSIPDLSGREIRAMIFKKLGDASPVLSLSSTDGTIVYDQENATWSPNISSEATASIQFTLNKEIWPIYVDSYFPGTDPEFVERIGRGSVIAYAGRTK